MVNVELRLLSTMLHRGDFTPIQKGEISEEHFVTDEGKLLYQFIVGYRMSTSGEAKYPSLSIVRLRFDQHSLDLPDPDPGDNIAALSYEVRLQFLRATARTAATILDDIAADPDDPLEVMTSLTRDLQRVAESTRKPSMLSIRADSKIMLERYATGGVVPTGIPWIWDSLQEATRGMVREDWYVFAGRPKVRKTFTVLAATVLPVLMYGTRTLVVSMEMPAWQMLIRSFATMARVPYSEFKKSELNEAEEMRLCEIVETFGSIEGEDDETYEFRLKMALNLPAEARTPGLWIVKGTGRSLSWVESQIEIFDPDIVYIDSFARLRPDSGKAYDSDWKAVTSTSRGLKDLNSDRKTIGFATHHINRAGSKSTSGTESLALSDAVGQDADLIMRIYTGILADEATGERREVSALINIGGREVNIEGLLINNVPCSDFTEIGPLTNKSRIVEQLTKEEDAAEAPAPGAPGGPKHNGAKKPKKDPAASVQRVAAKLKKKIWPMGATASPDAPEETEQES